jgi:hypothetical protein
MYTMSVCVLLLSLCGVPKVSQNITKLIYSFKIALSEASQSRCIGAKANRGSGPRRAESIEILGATLEVACFFFVCLFICLFVCCLFARHPCRQTNLNPGRGYPFQN